MTIHDGLQELPTGALGAVLAERIREADYSWSRARPNVLADVKAFRRASLAAGEQTLRDSGSGLQCARQIAEGMDELIAAILFIATRYIYPADNPSAAERLGVLATGGYGRRTLAPSSDVDLLFLYPYRQTPWTESIVETILYLLWDSGLIVGHATRSIDDCIRLARSDLMIRTALLESRHICGEEDLSRALTERFETAVVRGTGPEFIAAKLEERDQRHRRQGLSRYLVEPNVKEGKGGLRDLHTMFWIAKYFYRVRSSAELVRLGVFSEADRQLFRHCDDRLWAVRCHLHFLTHRPEERLSFDLQREVAQRLGYKPEPGLSAVERFMKDYFLVAKDVGDLTQILCAALEEEHVKQAPSLNRFLRSISGLNRRTMHETGDFIVDNDRVTVATPAIFRKDPLNILRIFMLAIELDLSLHPDAVRSLRLSLDLIDDDLRADQEANAIFVAILTSPGDPESVLRKMNEVGVLGRFVPDFGKIVAMMQFNMYHHYTVDEHLIRSVGTIADIEHGRAGDKHALAARLFRTVKNRRILYLAIFLHDIAKGRPEDHSLAGAEIARSLCPRFGFSEEECETVQWLVEHHLMMSITAQSRDLSDPKTIRDFADLVQTPERLKLLEILTEADIAAVGPGVWNGWKAQLLGVLYDETALVLTAGHTLLPRSKRVAAAKAVFDQSLPDVPAAERAAFLAIHQDPYWLRVGIEDQKYDFDLIRRAEAEGLEVATAIRIEEDKGVAELTVLAPDTPSLLTVLSGACVGAGANIVRAWVYTTNDGRALDTIALSREFARTEDEQRRAERIASVIRQVLNGDRLLPEVVESRLKDRAPHKAFRRRTEVALHNDLSDRYTAIEISCLDRPGLIYDLTCAMAEFGLNIRSGQLATFGERAVDVFYVTDSSGGKITDEPVAERIAEALIASVDSVATTREREPSAVVAA